MKISSPLPLFDTIASMRDPEFKQQQKHFISQIAVTDIELDFHHTWQFLQSYQGSEATFNSYRKEVERLLQWAWLVTKKSLRELKRFDIENYLEFCQKPPNEWIGTCNVPRFLESQGLRIANPEWRPFVVSVSKKAHSQGLSPEIKNFTLSQSSTQSIFSVLSSFYNFLIQEEYTEANPVALIRQKSKYLRKYQSSQIVRRLSELQWAYVIETAELMAQANPVEHERSLFIMNALYGMYLRISELAANQRWTPSMGHFNCDQNHNWWFTTVGKGNKERIISVSDAMLSALKRYRQFLSLSPLPSPGETIPLISKIHGQGPVTSTRNIRKIVQTCFDRAIARLQEDGFREDADRLMSATVHWLRHTGISDDVKLRPREHVRDDAGHGSSAITDRYIDIELLERHASAKRKKIKPLI